MNINPNIISIQNKIQSLNIDKKEKINSNDDIISNKLSKIDQIKKEIEEGTYKINLDLTAQAIIKNI